MEDLGSIVADKNRKNEEINADSGMKKGRRRIIGKKPAPENKAPREMITPALRAALTKQVPMKINGGLWVVNVQFQNTNETVFL